MIRRYTSRVFYGWWMVAAGFGIQLLTAGLLSQSYGAYVAVLQEQQGWSKTALAGAFSMTMLISGIVGPLQGPVMDRFGSRTMMQAGFVVFGGGFILLSQAHSLVMYYIAFAVVALGLSLTSFLPLTVSLVNWFERKRARVLSTMSLGIAVGGLLVPAVAFSLEHLGWRNTAFASGIIAMAIGIPLARVMRRRPEDYGEVVDGSLEAAPDEPVNFEPPLERDFTAREAMRTSAFWLIGLGHASALLVVGAVSVHVISHLNEDLHYTVASASLVVSLMTGAQVVGMLLGGTFGDRFDKRIIAAVCMFMHMIALLLIAFAASIVMVVAFAVLHGTAWGIRGPLMQAIRADYFGRSSFGAIMGVSTTIIMVGQIVGPLLVGLLADVTGDYVVGFSIIAVLAGLGSGFFILAKRPPLPDARPVATSQAAEPAS